MTLRLYNTLTRRKERFEPIDPQNVRMYVCGPTVYDYAHIGNARPVIVFDVLFRLLRHLYGPDHVAYVRNITDVDDKINARAREENRPIDEITAETTRAFHQDVAALGCLEPTVEPRATAHIAEMIAMIERLVANGCAYEADGHVLFHVPAMPDYGRLARRSTDEMQAGARVEVAPYKKDPMDFVLWKPSEPDMPGWDSPWGRGRPGWHIECSAMAAAHLGETFDIHGGGIDLVFPHHENEIAQSRCCFGTRRMAQVWMHNGYLQVEGEKMSKSLGNFLTVHDLLKKWPGDVLRLNMLKTHYRQPIDWTERSCTDAQFELLEWSHMIGGYYRLANERPAHGVLDGLFDDLNMPAVLAAVRDLHAKAQRGGMDEILAFAASCKFLGFRCLGQPGLFESGVSGTNVNPRKLFNHFDDIVRLRAAIANNASDNIRKKIIDNIETQGVKVTITDLGIDIEGTDVNFTKSVNDLVAARDAARKAKDFAEADRIRDELAKMGIELHDTPEGTTWEVAR